MKKFKIPVWIYVVHFVQERIRNPRLRNTIAKVLTTFLPSNPYGKYEKSNVNELKVNGFTFINDLVDDKWIADVQQELLLKDCFDPWSKESGIFTINSIPLHTHVAQIKDVAQIEQVFELANNENILRIVAEYFGCKPTLDSINAWWSIYGHDQPQEAENFHRDNDGIKFLKLFLYLTDVDDDAGPHLFVKGSHNSTKGLERRRFKDEEIENLFGKSSIIKFTGKKGIAFLEDTYGFHKGQLPKSERRLLLQFRYSIMPTIFNSFLRK